jgi:hypothetical protein
MRTLRQSSNLLIVSILALLLSFTEAAASAQNVPDFTQAGAMLDLLRACQVNNASAEMFDRVSSLAGTQLIVAQQNISRRVTMQQYRDVLEAACAGKIAPLKPTEPGTRAEKGIAGLTQDVGPSLIWGRDHIPLLESRLLELRNNPSLGNALPLAQKYFPEPVALKPKLYIVMGGRAGAAAIDDQLYFDVLVTEWRASQGLSLPTTPARATEFFAHETHHLGYGQILDRKRDSLKLTLAQAQVWDFLAATMMEGSATLLINGHEKIADLEKQPDLARYLTKVPELLPLMQDVLRKALNGSLSDEAYAEATSPFLNMGYHATGAVLLAAIGKKRGLAGVMDVMRDPRRLLAIYNDCSRESSVRFTFDPELANRVADIGVSQTGRGRSQ